MLKIPNLPPPPKKTPDVRGDTREAGGRFFSDTSFNHLQVALTSARIKTTHGKLGKNSWTRLKDPLLRIKISHKEETFRRFRCVLEYYHIVLNLSSSCRTSFSQFLMIFQVEIEPCKIAHGAQFLHLFLVLFQSTNFSCMEMGNIYVEIYNPRGHHTDEVQKRVMQDSDSLNLQPFSAQPNKRQR